ncbi:MULTISPECIES: nucleoside recognition domain-containing protein [Paenibacillus]|uniref:Nucleoside recognition protein n=1 Tax=Paenibacillus xylanilyticus TaxID=248903 RepID=A0A7Y6EW60_9BACL|nr:nucleoside recognition domain-containing protein [Paenibacillus xylanilyticus]NUU76404.1 nucleoside recognition protein [Paenibacillus xylanilyticus]
MSMQTEVTGSNPMRTVLLSAGALLLVVAVVVSPKDAFDASIQGLDIWWKIIFPAMLPFLMLSQMLTAFGFTDAFGVLLGPLMQRWFRLPGQAGLAIAVGMCGGFPAGADTAARLVQDRQITGKQASVLVAAAHFANPMMIILVLGAAFLHLPAAGYFLLMVHWISGWIAAMIAIRLVPGHPKGGAELHHPKTNQRHGLWFQMMTAAREAQARDGRGFGKLLGDTVSHAVQTLMMTGGYMIVFAVFVRLLGLYITPGTSVALWPAVLELHLGTYHLSQTPWAPVIIISLIAAVLGWGGLCSHLQVSAVLKSAGIASKTMIYFAGVRLIHALIAFSLSVFLWAPFSRYGTEVLNTFWPFRNTDVITPTLLPMQSQLDGNHASVETLWSSFPAVCIGLAMIVAVMISLSGLTFWFNRRFSR